MQPSSATPASHTLRLLFAFAGLLVCLPDSAGATANWLEFTTDGRWRAARSATAPQPGDDRRFDLADLNGDGKLDFAGNVTGGVQAALGNGDGTFQPIQYFGDGTSSEGSFALGDLNGDGVPDAVTADIGPGLATVSVFLGDGSGGFGPRTAANAGAGRRWLALGDLNRDGKLDLAYASSPSGGPYTVGMVPGNGAGGFSLGVSYAESSPAAEMSLTDLNSDGKLDMLWTQSTPNQVCYRLGNGNGTFGAATRLKQGGPITDVQAADLNNDNRPDLVWTRSGTSTDTTAIALGLSGGGFGVPTDIVLQGHSETLAIGDFNEDGKLDLIGLQEAGRSVYLGRGDGTFELVDDVTPLPTDLVPGLPINFSINNVVVADLDRDGHADIVYSLPAVDLGNGNGGFNNATSMVTAAGPTAAVFARISTDALPDLVVACRGEAKASLFINFANGSFLPKTDFPIGAGAVSICAADFNKDGWTDIATANQTANTVSILKNSKTNGFLPKADFAVGASPIGLRAADLNGDGNLDLVVLNNGATSVSVLLGDGTGSFAPKVDYPVNSLNPDDIVVGDFNNDSRPDVVVAGGSLGLGGILIRLGNGDGTLGAETSLEMNKPKRALACGDFNKDGKLDLAASDLLFQVTVLLGNGNGTFAAGTVYPVTSNAFSVESADIDGDGNLDILLGHSYGYFWALKGSPSGAFETMEYGFAGRGAAGPLFAGHQVVAYGDWMPNGRLSAATVGETTNSVSLLRNCGAAPPPATLAGWMPPQAYATGSDPRGMVISDFNRDGRRDVATAAAGPSAVAVHLGQGNGAFNSANDYAGPASIQGVAHGDVNKDGKPDIVGIGQSGELSVLLGDGNGGLGPKVDVDSGGTSHDVAVGDLDGNGTLDALVDNGSSGMLKAYSGGGNGTFAAPVLSALPGGTGCSESDIDLADLNNDGKLDAVVTTGSCGVVDIMIGNGSLSFTGTSITMGSEPSHVVVADFNGDGKLDLATSDKSAGTVVVRLQNPGTPGTFLSATPYPAISSPGDITAGDVDQDGDIDLLVGSTSQSSFALLKNNGGTFGASTVYSMNDPIQSLAVEDLNRDGLLDVLSAGSSTGVNTISVRLGTTTVITGVDVPPVPAAYVLDQNRPNPFNPVTKIRFAVGRSGPVHLRVYDARGRMVATLVDESMPAGQHEVSWTGKNHAGLPAASGVYFYKLEAGGYSMSKRMVLLK